MQARIVDLERLFMTGDRSVLMQMHDELKHRESRKALDLRSKIERLLYSQNSQNERERSPDEYDVLREKSASLERHLFKASADAETYRRRIIELERDAAANVIAFEERLSQANTEMQSHRRRTIQLEHELSTLQTESEACNARILELESTLKKIAAIRKREPTPADNRTLEFAALHGKIVILEGHLSHAKQDAEKQRVQIIELEREILAQRRESAALKERLFELTPSADKTIRRVRVQVEPDPADELFRQSITPPNGNPSVS